MSEPQAVPTRGFFRRNMPALGLVALFVWILLATIGMWVWSVRQHAAEIAYLEACGIRVDTNGRTEETLSYKVEELVLGSEPRGKIIGVDCIEPMRWTAEQRSRIWNVILRKQSLDTIELSLETDDQILSELAKVPKLRVVILHGASSATDAWITDLPTKCQWQNFFVLSPHISPQGTHQLLDKCPNLISLSVPAHGCNQALIQRIAKSAVHQLCVTVFADRPPTEEFQFLFGQIPNVSMLDFFGADEDAENVASLKLTGVATKHLGISHFYDVDIEGADSNLMLVQSTKHFRGRKLNGGLAVIHPESLEVFDSPKFSFARIDLNSTSRRLGIQRCSMLNNLSVNFSAVDECDFEFADLPALESLRLTSLPVKIAHALKSIPSLREISVDSITNSKAGAFAELAAMPNLEKLKVYANNSSLPYLREELAALPQVRQVEITARPPDQLWSPSRPSIPKILLEIQSQVNELRELYPRIEFILK